MGRLIINWVTQHHNDPQYPGPDVANMSFESPVDPALDNAVLNMINSGVIGVVAAGNNNTNASNVSPARVPEAITVSATNAGDNRIVNYHSSGTPAGYGSVVDLFAQGQEIVSASKFWESNQCPGTFPEGGAILV